LQSQFPITTTIVLTDPNETVSMNTPSGRRAPYGSTGSIPEAVRTALEDQTGPCSTDRANGASTMLSHQLIRIIVAFYRRSPPAGRRSPVKDYNGPYETVHTLIDHTPGDQVCNDVRRLLYKDEPPTIHRIPWTDQFAGNDPEAKPWAGWAFTTALPPWRECQHRQSGRLREAESRGEDPARRVDDRIWIGVTGCRKSPSSVR